MTQNLKILLAGLFLTLGAAAPASANCALCNDQQYPLCFAVMLVGMQKAELCLENAEHLSVAEKRITVDHCEEQLAHSLSIAESKCTMMKRK